MSELLTPVFNCANVSSAIAGLGQLLQKPYLFQGGEHFPHKPTIQFQIPVINSDGLRIYVELA